MVKGAQMRWCIIEQVKVRATNNQRFECKPLNVENKSFSS